MPVTPQGNAQQVYDHFRMAQIHADRADFFRALRNATHAGVSLDIAIEDECNLHPERVRNIFGRPPTVQNVTDEIRYSASAMRTIQIENTNGTNLYRNALTHADEQRNAGKQPSLQQMKKQMGKALPDISTKPVTEADIEKATEYAITQIRHNTQEIFVPPAVRPGDTFVPSRAQEFDRRFRMDAGLNNLHESANRIAHAPTTGAGSNPPNPLDNNTTVTARDIIDVNLQNFEREAAARGLTLTTNRPVAPAYCETKRFTRPENRITELTDEYNKVLSRARDNDPAGDERILMRTGEIEDEIKRLQAQTNKGKPGNNNPANIQDQPQQQPVQQQQKQRRNGQGGDQLQQFEEQQQQQQLDPQGELDAQLEKLHDRRQVLAEKVQGRTAPTNLNNGEAATTIEATITYVRPRPLVPPPPIPPAPLSPDQVEAALKKEPIPLEVPPPAPPKPPAPTVEPNVPPPPAVKPPPPGSEPVHPSGLTPAGTVVNGAGMVFGIKRLVNAEDNGERVMGALETVGAGSIMVLEKFGKTKTGGAVGATIMVVDGGYQVYKDAKAAHERGEDLAPVIAHSTGRVLVNTGAGVFTGGLLGDAPGKLYDRTTDSVAETVELSGKAYDMFAGNQKLNWQELGSDAKGILSRNVDALADAGKSTVVYQLGADSVDIASNTYTLHHMYQPQVNNNVLTNPKNGLPNLGAYRNLSMVITMPGATQASSDLALAGTGMKNYQDPKWLEENLNKRTDQVNANQANRPFYQKWPDSLSLTPSEGGLELQQLAAAKKELGEYKRNFQKWQQEHQHPPIDAEVARKAAKIGGDLSLNGCTQTDVDSVQAPYNNFNQRGAAQAIT